MKREEITGFRQPTNDEKKMIYELLWQCLPGAGKVFNGLPLVFIALEFLAFVKTADIFWTSKNTLMLLIGVVVMFLLYVAYKEIKKWDSAHPKKRNPKCQALENGDYIVKEVKMLRYESDPNSYSGDKAYICDLDGTQCDNRILVDPKVAKVISKNDGRALLMKLQDGTYFCLFAYVEDWKDYLASKK